MCNPRIDAIGALADAIGCEIAELRDNTCVGQSTASHRLGFPSMALETNGRWEYLPDQAEEVFCPTPGHVVMNVGRRQGPVTLRIGAKTPGERYDMEERITQMFFGTVCHPGIMLPTVNSCPQFGPFTATFELEGEDWRDEYAFDGKFYSFITLTGTVPALTIRKDAHTVHNLSLELVEQNDSAFEDLTFGSPDAEVLTIKEDGTAEAVP